MPGRDFLDVARRQCATVAVGQLQAGFLAMPLRPGLAQLVAPVAHDRGQLRFQRGQVDIGLLAALRPHDDVQLRQRRLADLDVGVDRSPSSARFSIASILWRISVVKRSRGM
jgi:hypothetical protein